MTEYDIQAKLGCHYGVDKGPSSAKRTTRAL